MKELYLRMDVSCRAFTEASEVFRRERPDRVEAARAVLRALLRERWSGETTAARHNAPWFPGDEEIESLLGDHQGCIREISRSTGKNERVVQRRVSDYRRRRQA